MPTPKTIDATLPQDAPACRSASDVFLDLAGHLERAAADLRRLAGPAAPSAIEPGLDDMIVDVAHIVADDEASVRRG
jgi:hypothetical protein